jgi:hypothetical protein
MIIINKIIMTRLLKSYFKTESLRLVTLRLVSIRLVTGLVFDLVTGLVFDLAVGTGTGTGLDSTLFEKSKSAGMSLYDSVKDDFIADDDFGTCSKIFIIPYTLK